MAADDVSPAAPAGRLARAWAVVVDGLGALGTVTIGILMVIICADIVARNVLGGSLPLVSELGGMLLVMIVALQLATAVRGDRLARTEIFYLPFRESFPRAGAVLSAIFHAGGAYLIGLAAWASVRVLQKDYDAGEFIGTPGLGTLPTWPFRALVVLGLAVAAMQFAVSAAAEIRLALRGRGAGR